MTERTNRSKTENLVHDPISVVNLRAKNAQLQFALLSPEAINIALVELWNSLAPPAINLHCVKDFCLTQRRNKCRKMLLAGGQATLVLTPVNNLLFSDSYLCVFQEESSMAALFMFTMFQQRPEEKEEMDASLSPRVADFLKIAVHKQTSLKSLLHAAKTAAKNIHVIQQKEPVYCTNCTRRISPKYHTYICIY